MRETLLFWVIAAKVVTGWLAAEGL